MKVDSRISFLLLFILFIYMMLMTEPFQDFWEGSRFRCPTRNMSYDLRGDIPIERKNEPMVFQQSTIGPVEPSSCTFRRSIFME